MTPARNAPGRRRGRPRRPIIEGADVKVRVAEISDLAKTGAARRASQLERELHGDVLRAIASTGVDDPLCLAREALKTEWIRFPR